MSDRIRIQNKIYEVVNDQTFELKLVEEVDPKNDKVMEVEVDGFILKREYNEDQTKFHVFIEKKPGIGKIIGAVINILMGLLGIGLIIAAVMTAM